MLWQPLSCKKMVSVFCPDYKKYAISQTWHISIIISMHISWLPNSNGFYFWYLFFVNRTSYISSTTWLSLVNSVYTWFQVCQKTYLIPSELGSVPDSKFVTRRTWFQVNLGKNPRHIRLPSWADSKQIGSFSISICWFTMTMNDDYPMRQE